MSIIYNGTEVTAVNYNGTALEKVNYNGVEVFSAGPRPTPDSYFTFTLQSDNTYSIKAKDVNNMPETLIIPSSYNNLPVSIIETDAFRSCSLIKTAFIPSSIKTINNQVFYLCTNLTKIEIQDGVTTIGPGAFRECPNLVEINIPDTVTSLGNYSFYGDKKLANITLSNNITILRGGTFGGFCTSLTNITLPSKLQEIQNYTFTYAGIINLEIPETVTTIGAGAFRECPNLSTVSIGSKVQSIGLEAFTQCPKLTAIIVNEANQYYKSVYGSLYSKDGTTLYNFPTNKDQTSFIVADGTQVIEIRAIDNADKLTTITLPASITELKGYAIANCNNLNPLTCKAVNPPTILSYTFTNTKSNCIIQVPAESVDAYKAAPYWKERARYIQAL